MSDLLNYCRDHTDDLLTQIETLVGYESFSRDKAATDKLVTYMEGQLAALGATVERLPMTKVGDLLLAKWGADLPGKPITFLAHLDTVWPAGTVAQRRANRGSPVPSGLQLGGLSGVGISRAVRRLHQGT